MRRILVLGIPGAGKSTFARRLGDVLDLPVHHLDRYFWNPGWKATPPDAWEARLRELLAGDEWIIEGNYRSTIPLRLERADTVIELDVPRHVAIFRVAKRIVTYRHGGRPDMAEGCPERWFDTEFIRYIWRFHKDVRPATLQLLEQFETSKRGKVVRVRNGEDIESLLHSLGSTDAGWRRETDEGMSRETR